MLKILSIICLCLVFSAPAGADQLVSLGEVQEQVVSGNFSGNGGKEQLRLLVLPFDPVESDLPPDYPRTKVDSFYKSSGEWLAIHQVSRQNSGASASFQSVPLNEMIASYDIMEFGQVCRDPDTGLDQLLLTLGKLGTANGDVDDTLFIHYSKEAQRLTTALVASMFVENCSLQQSMSNRAAHLQQRVDGRRLYERLKPQEPFELSNDLPRPLVLAHKTFTDDEMITIREELSSLDKRCRWYSNQWGEEQQKQQRYYVELLTENQRWQIYVISYSELWHAWGVLMAHNRQTGSWHSFYSIPAGGSRVLLYLSDYFELHENQLKLAVCRDCDWWGRYEDVTIDLDDFTLR